MRTSALLKKAAASLRSSGMPRLLHVDPTARRLFDRTLMDLPAIFSPRDVLVVNDAATLPASLFGQTARGLPVEVRLAGELDQETWRAVLFGAGDWRTPTEYRPTPPKLAPGASIVFAHDLVATLESVSRESPRLVVLRFQAPREAVFAGLYRYGHPVQYAYEPVELPLWRVQTPYATRPWAAEMPSAGRVLTVELLRRLGRRGVAISRLTHAAGLSSTGDPRLDAALPFPERFDLPQATVDAVASARARGGRVVAVGTTVVRALEGCAQLRGGSLVAGEGVTNLVIRRGHVLRVVDGLLSGIHAPDSSHYGVLAAFLPAPLDRLYAVHSAAAGYRGHEFGDFTLVLHERREGEC
jgi:S-adenosylmethionine:tRNA ribosyltransferase-isomerase